MEFEHQKVKYGIDCASADVKNLLLMLKVKDIPSAPPAEKPVPTQTSPIRKPGEVVADSPTKGLTFIERMHLAAQGKCAEREASITTEATKAVIYR